MRSSNLHMHPEHSDQTTFTNRSLDNHCLHMCAFVVGTTEVYVAICDYGTGGEVGLLLREGMTGVEGGLGWVMCK